MGRVKNKFSIDTIASMAHDLYDAGKTIGITHGAFDLFHSAHLELLKQASEQCDYLIVGMESDANVSKYKSYKRPIIPEERRSDILNAIEFSDIVFTNYKELENRTYEDIYKQFKVGVVAVGPNYGYMENVKKRANKIGTKLYVADVEVLQHSTTDIIEDIVKKYSE